MANSPLQSVLDQEKVDAQGIWIANQQQAWRFTDVGPHPLGETNFHYNFRPVWWPV